VATHRTCPEVLEPRRLLSAISFEPLVKYSAGPENFPPPYPRGPAYVAAGDFTSDGVNDIVAAGEMDSALTVMMDYVRVLPGRGDGTFGKMGAATPAGDYALSGVVTGDFNRDGRLDVAVSANRPNGSVHILLGNGDGTFKMPWNYSNYSGSHSTGLAAADFTGDGILDIVVSDAEPWTPLLSAAAPVYGAALLVGNGDGTFQMARMISTDQRPQHFVQAADVNSDGRPDAVFGQVLIGAGDFVAPESQVFAVLNDGDGRFQPPSAATKVGAAITGMELADLDGDARADVALSAMRDFMSPGSAAVLRGNGDGTFAAPADYPVTFSAVNDVAVADFNADGRPDLAVSSYNPASASAVPRGVVVALANDGAGGFGAPQSFGFVGIPAGLAAGHFNRDALPDLVTAIPAEDAVGVLVNNTKTIAARGVTVLSSAGTTLTDRAVGRFTLTGVPPSPAGASTGATALDATILWGDGTGASAGKVVANSDGTFTVLGTHTYRRARTYRIAVIIHWPDGQASRTVWSLAKVRT
jgi:hypothetical protein